MSHTDDAPPPAPAMPGGRGGMGLSARVGLTAGAAVVVAIVLTSILLYLVTARTLRSELDTTLEGIARDVNVSVLQPGPRQDPFGGRAGLVQFLSPDGTSLVGVTTGEVRQLPVSDDARDVATEGQPERLFETQVLTDQVEGRVPMRILTIPMTGRRDLGSLGPVGAMQVAVPMTDVVGALTQLRTALVFGGLLGTILAGGAGWWLGRRMVRPVLDLTTVAEDVRSTGDLTRRLDVTGDDEVAQLARTFNAMLVALERIQDSQTRLVADASHELRTPLTSLRTNIEVLEDYERLDHDDRRDLLRDVRLQLEEFGQLIESLVALTRDARANITLAPVQLDELVHEITDSVRAFAPADRPIEVRTDAVDVAGDEDSLGRAIRNLLDNAVKYGLGSIEVTVTASDDEAVVTVDDHGPGVAPEHRQQIFDRFHRAPDARDRPGSGLGLAIVAQAMAVHGGRADCTDAPGGGARFRLVLPRPTSPA